MTIIPDLPGPRSIRLFCRGRCIGGALASKTKNCKTNLRTDIGQTALLSACLRGRGALNLYISQCGSHCCRSVCSPGLASPVAPQNYENCKTNLRIHAK